MYITDEVITDIERKYGTPQEIGLAYEMTPQEFESVRRSQKRGRAHDVTLFIIHKNRVVVIKKPMYPDGVYRAPSGGIEPGESFEAGTLREALEETGLIVRLELYLLRARVTFKSESSLIQWTTHVLIASPTGGELAPIDTHEIVEARYATVEELAGCIRDALLNSGSTGLRYRAQLGDIVLAKLIEGGRVHPSGTAG